MGPSWGYVGGLGGYLKYLRTHVGRRWLGKPKQFASLNNVAVISKPCWAMLGSSWGYVGPAWGQVEAILGHFGGFGCDLGHYLGVDEGLYV